MNRSVQSRQHGESGRSRDRKVLRELLRRFLGSRTFQEESRTVRRQPSGIRCMPGVSRSIRKVRRAGVREIRVKRVEVMGPWRLW